MLIAAVRPQRIRLRAGLILRPRAATSSCSSDLGGDFFLGILSHLVLLHDARHRLLLGAIFGCCPCAFFRAGFLLCMHPRCRLGLRLGDSLLVLQARGFEHALRVVAHLMRFVAGLFGDRGFLARGFAHELFGGGADSQRGLGLRFGHFALALGFFTRLALGVDAFGKFGLGFALGVLARGQCPGLGFFACLALGRNARFDFRARPALGFCARLAHRFVAR
jgi:hypothetical protein